MKKLIVVIGLAFLLIGCGVNENTTEKLNDKDFAKALKAKQFGDIEESFICSDAYKEGVKYFYTNFIVLNNGEIYDINRGKLFSNDENCRKNESGLRIDRILNDEYLFDVNGEVYHFDRYDDNFVFDKIEKENDKEIIIKNYEGILFSINTKDGYYVLRDDGSIYLETYEYDYSTKTLKVLNQTKLYDKDEFSGDVKNMFIVNEEKIVLVTDKAVYKTVASNKEDCEKYVDVECNYKMEKDEFLSNNIDKIIYLDYSNLYANNTVYYNNSYFNK